MLHHIEDARVTSSGEVISNRARVTENGGIVKIYVPDNGARRWRSLGWMKFSQRKSVGDQVQYIGLLDGRVTTWNVTPNPCRTCK